MTDHQIRDHIDSVAQPLSLDEIIDTSVVTRVVPAKLPRRLHAGAIAAMAIVAVTVAGLVAIATRDSDSVVSEATVVQDTASTETSVQSTDPTPSDVGTTSIGTEVPLVEVAVTDVQQVAKPGSAHAFDIEGHPPIVLWTTLSSNIQTGGIGESQCVSEAGSSGCGSTSIPAQFSQTSSVDNHVASDDLFTWSNLPPDVDTVRYDDGITRLWQRPVAGLAIFRVDPDHSHPDIAAYDATGAKLPYSFWGQNPPLSPATEPTLDPANQATFVEMMGDLETLIQTALQDCLTASGATWIVANVPTFAGDADPQSIWSSCVTEVQSIVAGRIAELSTGP